jgi:hypothetical protein
MDFAIVDYRLDVRDAICRLVIESPRGSPTMMRSPA